MSHRPTATAEPSAAETFAARRVGAVTGLCFHEYVTDLCLYVMNLFWNGNGLVLMCNVLSWKSREKSREKEAARTHFKKQRSGRSEARTHETCWPLARSKSRICVTSVPARPPELNVSTRRSYKTPRLVC